MLQPYSCQMVRLSFGSAECMRRVAGPAHHHPSAVLDLFCRLVASRRSFWKVQLKVCSLIRRGPLPSVVAPHAQALTGGGVKSQPRPGLLSPIGACNTRRRHGESVACWRRTSSRPGQSKVSPSPYAVSSEEAASHLLEITRERRDGRPTSGPRCTHMQGGPSPCEDSSGSPCKQTGPAGLGTDTRGKIQQRRNPDGVSSPPRLPLDSSYCIRDLGRSR